jgi:hypothetical protein
MDAGATGIFHIWSSSARAVLCEVSEPTIILQDDWAARVGSESLCPECAAKWRIPNKEVAQTQNRQRVRSGFVPAEVR